jgi:hypothetical protein
MLALILLSLSEVRIFNAYDPNQVRCHDMGLYEKYCPRKEHPKKNHRYYPNHFKLENDEITPKIYYNKYNITEIVFKTKIICGGLECNSKFLEVYVYPKTPRDNIIYGNNFTASLITIMIIIMFPFLLPIVLILGLICPKEDDFGGFS